MGMKHVIYCWEVLGPLFFLSRVEQWLSFDCITVYPVFLRMCHHYPPQSTMRVLEVPACGMKAGAHEDESGDAIDGRFLMIYAKVRRCCFF